MFFLIGTMVYPYYYATQENRFAELFHDLIPSWIAPQDMKAIEYYYEGLPQGAPIPWQPWVEPLANWFALIMAMGFMLVCMSSILHRQWAVHERLTYPMLQVPQAMIEARDIKASLFIFISLSPFLSCWRPFLLWRSFY